MLELQKELMENGIENTIKKYNLFCVQKEDLILLKYDQIRSNFSKPAVKQARGIILHKDTFEVISLAFVKFTNHTDNKADKIDWATARVQNKLDGSIIQLYYYNGWKVGTSGTLFGEGNVGMTDITYRELFWDIVPEGFENGLDKSFVYVFELTTNKHTIVTPFTDDNITLLTVRNRSLIGSGIESELERSSVEDIAKTLGVEVIEEYPIKSLEDAINTFKELKFIDEGYVVVDSNFNRVKVKNPAWNAAHHNKGATINKTKLIDIVKSNEVIEFAEAYPNIKNTIFNIKKKYDKLINLLVDIQSKKGKLTGAELAKLIHKTIKEQKLNVSLVGICFSFINSSFDDAYEFINQVPNKKIAKNLGIK